ncbi:hypothetical protein [Cytobacillus praedii]|nr:hypothetical protein [Cytobacillus praedii]
MKKKIFYIAVALGILVSSSSAFALSASACWAENANKPHTCGP